MHILIHTRGIYFDGAGLLKVFLKEFW